MIANEAAQEIKLRRERAKTPKLELRTCISPTDNHLRTLRYFLESVSENGGPIAKAAHCVVSLSPDEPHFDILQKYPWTADHSIEFRWVDAALFEKWEYHATGFDRLWVESDADVVALVDSDLLVGGDFDDVVERAYRDQEMLGFMAHVSPFGFEEFGSNSSEKCWKRVYSEAQLPTPNLDWRYSGWGLDWDAIHPTTKISSNDPRHKWGPPYFNYGFIVGPRTYVDRMGETFISEIEAVYRVTQRPFASQVANCLAFQRHNIPCGELSINYNFPMNLPEDDIRTLNLDPNGKNGVDDIKIFHYIGQRTLFSSQETVQSFLEKTGLDGAWLAFQAKLRLVKQRICNDRLD